MKALYRTIHNNPTECKSFRRKRLRPRQRSIRLVPKHANLLRAIHFRRGNFVKHVQHIGSLSIEKEAPLAFPVAMKRGIAGKESNFTGGWS